MENSSVIEQTVPAAQLLSLKFDLLSGEDIEKFSNVNINDASDVTNAKLGLPSTSSECLTCGASNIRDCEGHFGVLKLPATIYHPYLLPEVVRILNKVCPGCKSIKKEMQKEVRRKNEFSLLRRKLLKMKSLKLKLSHQTQSILFGAANADVKLLKGIKRKWAKVENQTGCKYCTRKPGEWYPTVKFKISNDKRGKKGKSITAEFNESLPRKFRNKSLSEVLPGDFWKFIPMYPDQLGADLNKINLSPSQAFYLLRDFKKGFIEQFVRRRDLIFLSCLPVTPNCQRVVERSHADGLRLSFDESTKAYRKAVDSGKKLNEFRHHRQIGALAASYVTNCVHDCLSASKLHSKQISGEDHSSFSGLKWVKEVVLSKRTDNTFRMVMVGDPKIEIGEIGVPRDIARTLYIAEHVNVYNVEKLKQSCRIHLLTKELSTRIKGKLSSLHRPDQLKVGSILYKPLENGDLVLVNRNPSVHQHSLLGLSVKILPAKSVVSINPLCCAPLLGDFDGDCLHGYIPQSVSARAELREIVSLDRQLLNGQDGRSLVSLTHDSLTAAHLLTKGDVLLNKFELQQLEMLCPFQSEYPAILKGPTLKRPYWTGHQLLSNLFPPNMDFVESGQVEICKGEVVESPGVSWLQNSTSGIFSWMFKIYGKDALNHLSSGQDALCEYLTMRGLSVSLSDIYLTSDPYMRRKMIHEVSCGLDHAKKSTYFNELLLEPDNCLLLKAYDENEDLSHCLNFSDRNWERRPIDPSSIIKFKDFFHELLNVIRHYISKDNSILSMVHAGSKGSLLKLVQQGVCLGLQLPSNSLHFSIPCKLSCSAWNQHKASIKPDGTQDHLECCEGKNSYAVIESSMLDGLNPLQCFFHALSGRANLFSGNAEVSGTLTRKLMFYMRDLFVAYDGTVRSPYGNQIVQFYYSHEASTEAGDYPQNSIRVSERDGVGGQPVGSSAACAVGEAAYSALDHAVNNVESSPLQNLKKVLQCAPSRTSVNKTASLILSEKLRKLNYGFEYAALFVKDHLERAFFSDVVTSVMIFYSPDDVQGFEGVKLSPWISHFHVNKEIVIRKRLNLRCILDMLNEYYSYMRKKLDTMLPKLCITIKKCLQDSQQKAINKEYCIKVAVEDSDSLLLLDTIRDSVIPILLDTLIKGFSEFKQVDILCDSRPGFHDLYLKVAMSEVCTPGRFWHTLQNACVPIIDLIDWGRSRPDGVHDISSSFGISCAWEYFVGSLKSAISDIGRSIHPEHLLLVADRLSVSGEFYGLNAKGLKQRKDLSLSSPFTQACFSNPEDCFIEAAKQGLENPLCGNVDSVAWGKIAPVGTGGPFEVIYSEKVCNQISTENIYETLLSRKHDTSFQDLIQVDIEKRKRKSVVPARDGRIGECNDCIHSSRKHTSIRCSKSMQMPVGPWPDIWNMVSSLREILNKYPINEHLNAADKYHVIEALQYHPRKDVKIGNGIKEIKIGYHPYHAASRCFILIRNDGTTEDFSFRKCVIGAAKQISSDLGRLVEEELNRK